MGVKHREMGDGNKTGTFLRNGGEGLGRRDSFLLHALVGPAGSALHWQGRSGLGTQQSVLAAASGPMKQPGLRS